MELFFDFMSTLCIFALLILVVGTLIGCTIICLCKGKIAEITFTFLTVANVCAVVVTIISGMLIFCTAVIISLLDMLH